MANETARAGDLPRRAIGRLRRRPVYYGYWLIGAALVAQFVAIGSQNYVIGTFFKPMTEDLGWSRSEFTVARTVGQIVLAFTGFFVGSHVDRHGGRRLMLIGICVLAASLFLLGYTQTLWQFILLNGIVLSAGAAMIGNLVVNVTLSKWFVEQRGRAISLAAMGISAAGIFLPPVVTAAIDEWGWRAAWRLLALGSLVFVVPVALMMRRAPEDYGLHPDGRSAEQVAAGGGAAAATDFATSMTRGQALHTPSFYLLVMAFGVFGLTVGVMLLQTIPFMTDAGYGRGTASLMITIASIPAMLSKPVWGFLIDRSDARRLASVSALVTATAMLAITLSVRANIHPLVYGSFFLLGCGWGGLIPLQEVVWATFFGRRYLGAVRSAGLPFALILGAGGPLLVSIYFDAIGNYDGAFYAVAVLNVMSAILLLMLPPPRRDPVGEGA